MKSPKKKLWIGLSSTLAVLIVIVLVITSIYGSSSSDHTEKSSKLTLNETSQHTTDVTPDKKKEQTEDKNQTEKKMTEAPAQEKSKAVKEADTKSEKAKTSKATPVQKEPTQKKEETHDSKAAVSTVQNITPITKYVTASALNVRSGPGTSHSAITSIKQGQAVTVSALSDSWSKIKVDGKTGWVASRYLSTNKPEVKKVATKKPTTSTTNTNSKGTTTSKTSQPANVADQLKTVDGNQQLILVTTNGYSTDTATIRTFEKDSSGKWHTVLSTNGYVGKYGITSDMHEGGKKSPIGKFTIGTAFGREANPGTKLSYRRITSDDVWVDDPKSKLYNTWQSRSKTKGQWNSAENMDISAYTYGFVINYNTQRIPYKGSAIFFHIGNSYTLGCTATSESNVVSILRWLDPAKHPVIIQTPVQGLSNF